jgi:hypothetical protein
VEQAGKNAGWGGGEGDIVSGGGRNLRAQIIGQQRGDKINRDD